jgi:hypothetical protein
MFPKYSDWNIQYTTKGLLKHRLTQALEVLTFALTILAAYRIRHDVRGGVREYLGLGKHYVKFGLLSVLMQLQRVVSKV